MVIFSPSGQGLTRNEKEKLCQPSIDASDGHVPCCSLADKCQNEPPTKFFILQLNILKPPSSNDRHISFLMSALYVEKQKQFVAFIRKGPSRNW